MSIIAISSVVVCYCILIYYHCMLIFTKVCFTCSVNHLTLRLLDSLHIWKRVILPFKSLLWVQRSLVFVGNIYAIYFFLSVLHYTGVGSSLWRSYHHWLHWRVSFRQLMVLPVTRVLSGWGPFHFSEPPKIIVIVVWCLLNLTLISLCVSCHSYCYLLHAIIILCYVCLFMLFMSDNGSCGYRYLLTVPNFK